MNSHASTSRYILTALAIILVITAFILVGLNAMNLNPSFSNPLAGASQEELDAKYREGFLKARAMYADRIAEMPASDATAFSGIVVSNNGSELVVRALELDTDMLVDGVGQDRTVRVVANTKIRELQPKDAGVLEAELNAFEARNEEGGTAPSPDVEKIIPLSEVKEGMHVRIHSASAVRLLPTIDATVVTVLK
jgi:hypothetical protein